MDLSAHTGGMVTAQSPSHHRPLSADSAASLLDLSYRLEQSDPYSAELLADLANELHVEGTGPSSGEASRWSTLNLFDVFDIDRMAYLLTPKALSAFTRAVELLRAVLIMAPIVLTWFQTALAIRAYRADLDSTKDPMLSGQSFVYLWGTGFNKHLSRFGLTFDQLALADAGLIFVVILLTGFLHWRQIWGPGKDDIARSKSYIRRIMTDASLHLHSRYASSQEAWFLDRSEKLLNHLRDEQIWLRELTNERSHVIEDLRMIVSEFKKASAEILAATWETLRLYERTASKSESLLSTIQAAAGDQARVSNAISDLGRDIREATREFGDALGETRVAAESVARQSSSIDAGISQLASTGEQLASRSSEATKILGSLRRLVRRMEDGPGHGVPATREPESAPPGDSEPANHADGVAVVGLPSIADPTLSVAPPDLGAMAKSPGKPEDLGPEGTELELPAQQNVVAASQVSAGKWVGRISKTGRTVSDWLRGAR